jgi:hypothetical protein
MKKYQNTYNWGFGKILELQKYMNGFATSLLLWPRTALWAKLLYNIIPLLARVQLCNNLGIDGIVSQFPPILSIGRWFKAQMKWKIEASIIK